MCGCGLCRLPSLAEAGWDVWERLAALEPADSKREGSHVAGQLEPGLAAMTAVVEQRERLQVHQPSYGFHMEMHADVVGL